MNDIIYFILLAGGLQGLLILCYPTMRSHIAKLVGADNQGISIRVHS